MRVESETSVARDMKKTMLGRGMGGINPFDGGSPFYTQQARENVYNVQCNPLRTTTRLDNITCRMLPKVGERAEKQDHLRPWTEPI